jgi:hypothetical protein
MSTAKTFGTVGTPKSELTATPLFPFTSKDTVYAGSCEGDNPNPNSESNPPGALAMASVFVPANGATKATIQLPPLNLTVKNGNTKTAISGAEVAITDLNCIGARRAYTTNSSGQLPEPGLPWSTYTVCASAPIKTEIKKNEFQTVTRHAEIKSSVENINGTTAEISINSGSTSGTCP